MSLHHLSLRRKQEQMLLQLQSRRIMYQLAPDPRMELLQVSPIHQKQHNLVQTNSGNFEVNGLPTMKASGLRSKQRED